MDTTTPEQVFRQVNSYLKSQSIPRYQSEKFFLYHGESSKEFLADLCNTLHLPLVPISQHAENRESGIYLEASKQWEYLKAWEVIDAMTVELGRPLKIADIGGGRGAFSAYLAKKGHEVEVFDINYLWKHGGDFDIEHRFQKWGGKNGLKVSYGSLFNVPARTGAYDIVISVSVLEHVPEKVFAFKESLRLLRSGGKFILSFDFTEDKKALEDSLRVEIFTPDLLNSTLSAAGIKSIVCSAGQIEQSAMQIQKDQVAGIPSGMTVASLTITCLHKQN
jgi:2-polyprenyl-3-methyl-5-hydroxy-6-metoxy-1,4-benzoquinol methylase